MIFWTKLTDKLSPNKAKAYNRLYTTMFLYFILMLIVGKGRKDINEMLILHKVKYSTHIADSIFIFCYIVGAIIVIIEFYKSYNNSLDDELKISDHLIDKL